MTDKTKSQTYNFLLKNKSIEDIKKQTNIDVKEIKNKRHSGQTYRIDNANNQPTNDDLDDLSENNREKLEPVTSNLTNDEKEQEINNDIWTKFKNYLNWPTSNTEELIQAQKKYIEQLEQSNLEKDKENQQLKNENAKLKLEQSNVNFDKFKYNAITIYDEKQSKKTGIDKIYEEILPIEDKIIFITTFVHDNESITEEILHFYQLTNGNIEVMKQYENINKYKDDLSLIEPNSNHEKIIKIEPVSIKKFLNNQKEAKLNITKSEWITFFTISIFSLCLLSIPAVLTIYLPTIIVGATVGIIIAEKIGILAVSNLVIGALDKVLWKLVSHKIEKIKTKTKNTVFWLLRKLPFCKSISKNKEEIEIKNNIKKTIENLINDKFETKLQTQYDILKQELNNRKEKNPDKLINNNKPRNHNSNIKLENQNFDSSIRNTVNQSNETSTIPNHNWNKVKCLLAT